MVEIWKPIAGYEGFYEVSNLGRVKSMGMAYTMNGAIINKPSKILSACDDGKGYLRLHLKKNKVSKNHRVHRLVAEAFVDNPLKLPKVNHKDGNKKNNHADNLEWCTQAENVAHAYANGMSKRCVPVPVVAIDEKGNEYYFKSQCEAARKTGIPQQNISSCCNGKLESAGGYKWQFQ